jgi:hypothetical protein
VAEQASTAEAKAYTKYLKLSAIELKATESFSGQTITEIEGKITNAGDRTVEYAAVLCIFYDWGNQEILREKAPIVKKSLKPGETRAFRLPFDTVPNSWNTRLPQVVIAQLRLS